MFDIILFFQGRFYQWLRSDGAAPHGWLEWVVCGSRKYFLLFVSSSVIDDSQHGSLCPLCLLQGVPELTLVSLQRPINLVWKQLLGQVGAVFKTSGYHLSFEPKNPGLCKSISEKIASEVAYIGLSTLTSVFCGTPCMSQSHPAFWADAGLSGWDWGDTWPLANESSSA